MLDTRPGPAVPADRHPGQPLGIEKDHQLAKQSTGLDARQTWTQG
jgi:hypothetical protein